MTTEPLKVVLYDASSGGGVCHYTHDLATHLAQGGHEITVVTNEGYELSHLRKNFKTYFLFRSSTAAFLLRRLLSGRAPVEKEFSEAPAATGRLESALTWLRFARLCFTFWKFTLFVLSYRPHVIHFQWLVHQKFDFYLIRLLKILGFKLVYTVHDLVPQESDAEVEHTDLKRIYRNVDAIIVHAEKTKLELQKEFRLKPDRVFVIPHGSGGLLFGKRKHSKKGAKNILGITPEHKVILFFGIVKRYKGLEYLLEAFQEVKQQISNTTLLVVGSIYEGDRDEFAYYSRLLEETSRQEGVVCVSNYVPHEDIPTYFAAADVVILPYTRSYTSGVLLAAYAAARPVIVTDTGALSEVVVPGRSGIVVPPLDAKAITKAILDVISNSNSDEMGRYAKYLAETKYSWRNVALYTAELYGFLLGPSPVEESQFQRAPKS